MTHFVSSGKLNLNSVSQLMIGPLFTVDVRWISVHSGDVICVLFRELSLSTTWPSLSEEMIVDTDVYSYVAAVAHDCFLDCRNISDCNYNRHLLAASVYVYAGFPLTWKTPGILCYTWNFFVLWVDLRWFWHCNGCITHKLICVTKERMVNVSDEYILAANYDQKHL